MPRGGARPNSGPKKKHIPEVPVERRKSEILLEALNRPADPKDSYQVQEWRKLTEAQDLNVRATYRWKLTEHAWGRAVHTVNHLHDKPIEMNVTVTLSEAIQKARKRAGIARETN